MESAKAELRQTIKPQLVRYRIDDKLNSPPPVSVLDAPSAGTMMPSNAGWMAPPTSEPRWRHGNVYSDMPCAVDENCSTVPGFDSFTLQSGVGAEASRPVSMDQDIMSLDMTNSHDWPHKSVEDSMGGMEQEGPIGQAYTTDDAVPMLDLRYPGSAQDEQTLNLDGSLHRRRMSGSSLTTSGAMSDLPSYDDFSAALSEAPSYGSDYPATSNRNSLMSSIHVSPVASPHMTPRNRSEQVRAHSRGRATPSPRASVRSVPYSIDGSKSQRWSTGSYAPAHGRRQSPFVYGGSPELYAPQRMSYHGPMPSSFPSQAPSMNLGGGAPPGGFPGGPRAPYLVGAQPVYHRSGMLLPTQPFHTDMGGPYDQPPPLPSQGLFKMLQSNGDPRTLHGHYTDLSDPPDLYSALHEEQIPPPEEDMNPSDPDLMPYEQELRFEGDLYTPRWVRGHGNKREGWCGICKPGRWLVLKNSAFWYDKSFTHGISAATGCPFQEPLETRRMDGNPDVWEGLCSSCNDWVALVSSKKKGTTWFRHAYKCHTHPKVKDGPKRRRDAATSSGARAAVALPKVKLEPRAPTPDASSMRHAAMPSHFPGLVPEPLHLAGSRSPAPPATGLGNMV